MDIDQPEVMCGITTGVQFIEPWNGEGLPPVGTVCEINHPTLNWVRCEIVAHKHFECGSKTHAIAWIDGDTLDQSQGLRFRPIRTPEQIAAEVRETSITEMMGIFMRAACGSDRRGLAAIYDAGYRKFEIVEGE